MERYIRVSDILFGGLFHLSSRGCPYSCSYCSNSALGNSSPGRYYRLRSPQNVIQEIKRNKERYRNGGFRNVVFADTTFGLNKQQMCNFCQLYIKEGLNRELSWVCSTHINTINKGWASQASRAGCAWVCLGVESGDDYIRNQVYKKNISRQQIREAVRYLRENDIMSRFTLMIGCPQETRDSIAKSLKLIEETRPTIVCFNVYQPLPRTELAGSVSQGPYTGKAKFLSPWLISNTSARDMKARQINNIMWRIRLWSLWIWLRQGLQLRGLSFIRDIVKYLLSINGCRAVPLMHSSSFTYLQYIVHRYLYQDWKQRHKHKLGL
jgi:radical SAM superfamily enzyme YgiQ (UPF0313 family)